MKIVTLNAKNKRYALIFMKYDHAGIGGKCIDNTITYYYSDSLKELERLKLDILNASGYKYYPNIDIYDYKEMRYVK